jgi:hypothetical protein
MHGEKMRQSKAGLPDGIFSCQFLVYFGKPGDEKFGVHMYFMPVWYLYCQFGIFYGHLVFLWPCWYIFPNLVCCTKKNLATLVER